MNLESRQNRRTNAWISTYFLIHFPKQINTKMKKIGLTIIEGYNYNNKC
jgi:hypothetical protein